MAPDLPQVTILQADNGERLTKRFYAGGVEGYARATWFRPHEKRVPDFETLHQLLVKLEGRTEYLIVLGGLADHARGAERIRRRKTDRGDDKATLIDTGSRVVHFDLDNLPLPEGYGWTDPARCARWAWGTICAKVPAFADVSVHWQASSSAGTPGKDGLAKFHFWALLDQPIDEEQRRALLKMAGADEALATVNQPNYTAAPIFEGVPDPLAGVGRSGALRGTRDFAPVDKISFPEAEIRERKARKPRSALSGDIPAPEGLPGATTDHGRRMLESARARILGASQRNITINRTAFWIGGLVAGGEIALADAQAALMDAGQASGHDRYLEAVENGLRDGMQSPIRKDPEPEDLPPFRPSPRLDRETAIKAHGDTIRAWGRNSIRAMQAIREVRRRYGEIDPLADDLDAERKAARLDVQRRYELDWLPASRVTETTPLPREMVRGAQGIGKTAALVGRDGAPGVLHDARGLVSVMFLPDHGKAQEAARDYLANGTEDAPPHVVVRGRGAIDPEDPDGNTMCRVPDLASKLANKGVTVRTALCSRCPFADVCGYLRQERRIERLAEDRQGVVLFAPHDYAFLPMPGLHDRSQAVDLAVFDERPRDMAVQDVTVTFDALGERLAFDGARRAQTEIGKAEEATDAYEAQLRFLQPLQNALRRAGQERPGALLASLREQGVTRAMVQGALNALAAFEDRQTGIAIQRANEVHSFATQDGNPGRWEARIEGAIDAQVPKATRALRVIFEALGLEIDTKRDQAVALLVEDVPRPGKAERAPGLRAVKVRDLRNGAGASFLHLDGTADPDMARAVFGDLTDHYLPVERNARITQVVGKSFANRSICGLKNDGTATTGKIGAENAALRADLQTILARHADAAVFGNKSVIEALGLGENQRAGHFGAIRGRNTWERAASVFVIGREQPGPRDVEMIARAYAAASGADFRAGDYRDEWRGIRTADGKAHGVQVARHVDPWGDRVLRQIREAEIEQAIDRVRLIHNVEPKDVYLLAPVVIDATVHRVMSWQSFKAGGTRIERAIEQARVLPLSKRECARLLPSIWPAATTAQRDLAADGLLDHFPYKPPSYGIWSSKPQTVCAYKTLGKQGERAVGHRAIVFAPADQARAVLEALTGPLAAFEVVETVKSDPQAQAAQAAREIRRDRREERAAIAEHDGRLSREDAERVADGLPPRFQPLNPVVADHLRRVAEVEDWPEVPKTRDGTTGT